LKSKNDLWEQVLSYCRETRNPSVVAAWIEKISLHGFEGHTVTLHLAYNFERSVILDNYMPLLHEAFEYVLKFPVEIRIITEEDKEAAIASYEKTVNDYEYTFDTFIVGPSNRFAHAACVAVSENPAALYNPLFIYGNSGLGKTHLLKAISHRIKEKFPQKKIENKTCEAFLNEYIDAVNNGTISSFREKYRSSDVLLLDDVQFLSNKVMLQEEIFNTFNVLHDAGSQIVFTSDRPPKDIATLDERLRGRFEEGLTADIQPPEFETRLGILNRKSQNLDLDIPDEITLFIADQLKSNIRQLEGVIKKLKAITLISDEPITLSVAQNAIRDLKNNDQPEPVTAKKIIESVSHTYSVSVEDILSAKHDSNISNARKIAMYIIRDVTNMTVKAIGEEFNRDYTTVLYSCKSVKKMLDKNETERRKVQDIINNLENH
jgi:chromosomal replication initiator protein